MKLLSTIAAAGAEDVTSETFGMHSYQDILSVVVRRITDNKRDMFYAVNGAAIANGGEESEVGG